MNHLDEQTIERYVLGAGGTDAEREVITRHLESCQGCKAVYEHIASFYADVDRLQRTHDEAMSISGRLAVHSQDKYLRIPSNRFSVAVRSGIRRHPIATSAGFLGLFGLVFAIIIGLPRGEGISYARARGEFLVAYDAGGNEQWRTHIGIGFEAEHTHINEADERGPSLVTTVDVNGDGTMEVIAALGTVAGSGKNEVLCYEEDGNLRWRHTINRKVVFGTTKFTDDYIAEYVTGGDYDHDGKMEIVVYARHMTYFPSFVCVLDAASGDLINEYLHPGWFRSVLQWDIDGDGVVEFILGGQNNSFNQACVVVLNAADIRGVGPSQERLTAGSLLQGREEEYVLFPPSTLGQLSDRPRSIASSIRRSGNLLQVQIEEQIRGQLEYVAVALFDNRLECITMGPHDDFVVAHARFKSEGRQLESLDQIYADLKSGLRYWNGSAFVEPSKRNR